MAGKQVTVPSWCITVAALFALATTFAGCRFDDTSIEQRACVEDKDCTPSGPSYRCVNGLCLSGDGVFVDATLDVPSDTDPETSTGLACGSTSCVQGQSCCDFQCIDPQTDDNNCGGCGLACSDGEVCLGGICTCGDSGDTCGIGRLCCPVLDSEGNQTSDASCRTVQSDPNNCGVCGNSCAADELCLNSLCVCEGAAGSLETCGDGDICCPGRGCANLGNDEENCGGCGVSCGLGETCTDGVCTCGTDAGSEGSGAACTVGQACCGETGQTPSCLADTNPLCSCGGASCQVGEDCCGTDDGDACIDTKRDASHCGACGVQCAAGQACVSSACVCQTGFADCDNNAANGCETTPATDVNNCGSCGNTCSGGQVCFNGRCTTSCQDNLTNCSGSCVNTNTDTQNCGGCNSPCAAGEKCSGGSCLTDCQEGLSDCGGNCVNFQTDKFNCGGCGKTCDSGQFCSNGNCVFDCPTGQVECGGSCISPSTDQVYCGAKGQCNSANSSSPNYQGATCGAGTLCSGGSCVSNCPTGQVPCSGGCVDLNTDRAHCGACGDPCGPGQVCTGGRCQASCPTGQKFCSPNCVDTTTSRLNCGDCGITCPDGQVCSSSACTTSCAAGFVNCEGTCIDPSTDLKFCGARLSGTCTSSNSGNGNYKGVACDPGEKCIGGTCQLDCATGTVNCGGSCINPNINRDFCGAALGGACNSTNSSSGNYRGEACADGELCSSGNCTENCPAGQIACLGTCVDTKSDADNCGGCNRPCAANQECVNSSCVCTGNFAECNGRGNDGCESFTPADPNNCGADASCNGGNTCTTGEACVSGSCECAADLVRCSGTCIDPKSNSTYCGATTGCGSSGGSDGNVCNGGRRCENGSCRCAPGLISCNGNCIDPDTNSNFCGASGNCNSDAVNGEVCGGAERCEDGNCVDTCPAGQKVCGGNCVDTDTNPTHCGDCNNETGGTNCNSLDGVDTAACQGGSCVIVACDSNKYNCSGGAADGCESSVACDAASCGNGSAETGEVCDGSDFRGQTCGTLGYDGGTLDCVDATSSDCNAFNVSGCTMNCPTGTTACSTSCVDTQTDPDHCGGCAGAGGTNCANLADVGSTYCSSGSCMILTCDPGKADCDGNAANGCEDSDGVCSCDADNVAEAGESCDGTDLRGLSCSDFGFGGGTLACSSCGFDTSGCTCGGNTCASGAVCISGTCFCGASTCSSLNGDSCTFSTGTCQCNGTSACDGTAETCSAGVGCE